MDSPKAWLIDLDGTLADTLGDFVAAWSRAAASLGLPAAEADLIRRLIGRGGERLVRELLGHVGADEAMFPAVWAAYRSAYAAVNGQHARVFDGADQALGALRQAGMRMACVTNKPQAQAEALLMHLGLQSHFDTVVGQAPALRPKPHPDAFEQAARQLGFAARDCGVIGDSRNDAEAARAAGCQPILLLRHGYNHGEPVDSVAAQAHLDDWPALLAWLQRTLLPSN